MTDRSPIDPALMRGLTQSRMSRRDLFRYAGVAGGAVGLSAFLAACGTKGVTPAASGGAKPNAGLGTAEWWSSQKLNKVMDFGNWPVYIDVVKATGDHPSLDLFTKQTGIKVNYTEPIDDNVTFFKTIEPSLAAGDDIGYDIIVLTTNDTPLYQMIDFGWAIPLDDSKMTNFKKYASDLVTDPAWDPGNTYTMAWQSGYTCIGWNSKYVKEDITSVQSLWDPKYKGHIGMLSNAIELGNLGLIAIGVEDPSSSTPDQWNQAASKLLEAKPLLRSYYDQNYIKALSAGDIWISQVFSGDIFQYATYKGYPELRVVIPQEGGMFWTDNMMIPYTSNNPLDAMTYMDAVYDPNMQAIIEDYNAYVCPVPAAKKIIAAPTSEGGLNDPSVANSPTVFPSAQIIAESKKYYIPQTSEDLVKWNNTFVPIYQ